jgi:hypothetical protein
MKFMKTKISIFALLFCATALFFYACKKKNNDSNKATVAFYLTDDPANYDHVYLDIQQVVVTMSGSSAVTLIPVHPGIYDLLQFRNGLDTLLIRAAIPAGTVEQIRLVLGSNNTVVVGGVSHELTTPSGQQSGVKLNLHQTFAAGGAYNVWIDFDAGKSIVTTGSGKYILKPVIRAYSSLTIGRIKGYVLPLNAWATVYAINGTDTATAIPSLIDGYFVVNGLTDANYTLVVSPGIAGLQPYTQSNVHVVYGVETNIGIITLHP